MASWLAIGQGQNHFLRRLKNIGIVSGKLYRNTLSSNNFVSKKRNKTKTFYRNQSKLSSQIDSGTVQTFLSEYTDNIHKRIILLPELIWKAALLFITTAFDSCLFVVFISSYSNLVTFNLLWWYNWRSCIFASCMPPFISSNYSYSFAKFLLLSDSHSSKTISCRFLSLSKKGHS